MRETRSRTVVLLLDCCYGGAFARGVTVRASGDVGVLDSFPRERQGSGRARAVITASGAMEFAIEGTRLADDSRHRRPSVFTAAVIEGLRTGEADRDQDGWISLDELYDYVFDKVREQTPNQSPNRHFELAGELFLARNPKLNPRANQQAAANNSSTPLRPASVSAPTDRPAKLPPREPASEPILPVPDWRSQLAVSDEPVEIRRPPQPRKTRRGTWALGACAILWISLSVWALRGHAANWLPLSLLAAGTACIAGAAALTKLDVDVENDLGEWALLASIGASLAAMIGGPVAALGLTVYAEFVQHTLQQRILLVVALFALLGSIAATFVESERRADYRNLLAEWRRAADLSDERLSKRWLAGQANWRPAQSLISQLRPIRAACFVQMPADDSEFAAVAGNRVLFVWRVNWKPGRYTLGHGGTGEIRRDGSPDQSATEDARRLARKSSEWKKVVKVASKEAQTGSVVIVNGMNGQPSPHLSFRYDGDLTYVTAEEFGDSAGGFLVKSQNAIDTLLLARLLRSVKRRSILEYR